MGAGFALTAIVALVAVVLGSWPDVSGPLGPASPGVLTLLAIGTVLLAGTLAVRWGPQAPACSPCSQSAPFCSPGWEG
jgi:hypothetical protein